MRGTGYRQGGRDHQEHCQKVRSLEGASSHFQCSWRQDQEHLRRRRPRGSRTSAQGAQLDRRNPKENEQRRSQRLLQNLARGAREADRTDNRQRRRDDKRHKHKDGRLRLPQQGRVHKKDQKNSDHHGNRRPLPDRQVRSLKDHPERSDQFAEFRRTDPRRGRDDPPLDPHRHPAAEPQHPYSNAYTDYPGRPHHAVRPQPYAAESGPYFADL